MSDEDRLSKLTSEKQYIEKSLAEGVYPIGVGVFKDLDSASLLLFYIHLLYSKDLGFNEDSVQAVESMLKQNFDKIYNPKIHQSNHNICYYTSTVKKFLSGNITQETMLEDIIHSSQQPSPTEEEIAEARNYLKSIFLLDKELVRHSYEKLKPFSVALSSNHCDDLAFSLASYFSSTEDIDNYLRESVDFSSFETIENTIDISNNRHEICNLSQDERNVWAKLNAAFGKQSIKLFAQANDLKNGGFDIVNESQTSEGLEALFNKVQEKIKDIKFTREDENNELADLVRLYNISESTFNEILTEILPHKKNSDQLPNIAITTKDQKYTFTKLPAGDLKSLFLGKMTACCQFIGGDSELCVIDGFTRETAGFYVLTDKEGQIKAQSYSWIGKNDNEEAVLILDSFEYLPEAKQYFLELVQNLSEMIKPLGYTELYVGKGGKTPILNQQQDYEISPQDSDLYRYQDSNTLYKITEDIALSNQDSVKIYKYSSFDEMIKYHHYISFEHIKLQDREGMLSELDHHSIKAIVCQAPILKILLSEGDITIESIKQLFSVEWRESGHYIEYKDDNIESYLLAWKESLKTLGNDCGYKEFMNSINPWHYNPEPSSSVNNDDPSRPYNIRNNMLDLISRITKDFMNSYDNIVETIKNQPTPLAIHEIFNKPEIYDLIKSYIEEDLPLVGNDIETTEI